MAIAINGAGTITGLTAGGLPDASIITADLANDAVTTAKVVDNAITLAKMAANSVDSDAYVDASIDNAHLADDAVGVAELSATGTASSSTFLRGDNSWVATAHTGNVAFPATQVASADANTLDDYEEGLWTPVIWDNSESNGESQAYTYQLGWYTKIGDTCHCWAKVQMSSLGSLTTSQGILIGGFPFTSTALTGWQGTGSFGYGQSFDSPFAATMSITAYMAASQTKMSPQTWSNVAGADIFSVAALSANGIFFLQTTYKTS